MSPSEVCIDMGCPCGGDQALCARLYVEGDLRILDQRLINAESNHAFLREELEQLRERIGRSALHVLDLRSRAAELSGQLEDVDDLTA